MRAHTIFLVAIALMCARGETLAQWLRYPTADVPRTADGKPNLNARPPRLPDGRTDFSGIWQSARKIQCTPEFGKFVECGLEVVAANAVMLFRVRISDIRH